MHITMIAAISLDGKLTNGNDSDVRQWTSAEDYAHLQKVLAAHNVHIMGEVTHKVMPVANLAALRIVLTRQTPHAAAPANVHFLHKKPSEVVTYLENLGHASALLVGGGYTFGSFLQEDLIDEFLITLEPRAYGVGTQLFGGLVNDASFTLLGVEKLNPNGSLLLHYRRMQ